MNTHLAYLLLLNLLSIKSLFAIDFVFNGFNPTDISLYGNATIESKILTLTNHTGFSIGRGLYPLKIPTKKPDSSAVLPFSTSFIFAMVPYEDVHPGQGMAFLFVPHTGVSDATASQYLGLFNRTNLGDFKNHVFAVEFDVVKNLDFGDISVNHVGIDVNSLTSKAAHEAGYWPDDGGGGEKSFKTLNLNNGKKYQVWIDFEDFHVNVTMVEAGVKRPKRPLISTSIDLSEVLEDEMYVGFTAATGAVIESHKILAWSFSNENFSLSEGLITWNLPSFELLGDPVYKSKWFIAGITIGLVFVLVAVIVVSVLLIKRSRRIKREKEEMESWELEYWPHRISYQEIYTATKGFSDENVVGIGGNGKVYKGELVGGGKVAVKRISQKNNEGMREFVSEISSLGRLKHRNLLGLRGWCKEKKGSLILVYDYMENGSLDKRVFECDESKLLNCDDRIRILKEVASGLLYLHEGWESKVVHRDIKASNVLLDRDMNARLGDFGLARMGSHSVEADTTSVAGTAGYLAPEVINKGRASTQTDVYGFGVLILEVMCGRRPIEQGKPPLLDWVKELMRRGESLNGLDDRLRAMGQYNEEEVQKVLQVGMLCTHPEPSSRPTMRQVLKFFEGTAEINEPEGEDMNAYLLARSKELWLSSSQLFSHGSYPTFTDIKAGLSASTSWSETSLEAR